VRHGEEALAMPFVDALRQTTGNHSSQSEHFIEFAHEMATVTKTRQPVDHFATHTGRVNDVADIQEDVSSDDERGPGRTAANFSAAIVEFTMPKLPHLGADQRELGLGGEQFQLPFHFSRQPNVVRIRHGDPRRLSCPNSAIGSGAGASVVLADDSDQGRSGLSQRGSFVRRAIVHDDDFGWRH
jgi:hypothetical protein